MVTPPASLPFDVNASKNPTQAEIRRRLLQDEGIVYHSDGITPPMGMAGLADHPEGLRTDGLREQLETLRRHLRLRDTLAPECQNEAYLVQSGLTQVFMGIMEHANQEGGPKMTRSVDNVFSEHSKAVARLRHQDISRSKPDIDLALATLRGSELQTEDGKFSPTHQNTILDILSKFPQLLYSPISSRDQPPGFLFPGIPCELKAEPTEDLVAEGEDQLAAGLCVPLYSQRDLIHAGRPLGWRGEWKLVAYGFLIAGTTATLYALTFEGPEVGATPSALVGTGPEGGRTSARLGKRKKFNEALDRMKSSLGKAVRKVGASTTKGTEMQGGLPVTEEELEEREAREAIKQMDKGEKGETENENKHLYLVWKEDIETEEGSVGLVALIDRLIRQQKEETWRHVNDINALLAAASPLSSAMASTSGDTSQTEALTERKIRRRE